MAPGVATLIQLPSELQREVLLRLDGSSLSCLSMTCRALRDAISDDLVWRELVLRRFRVSPSVARSPRLLACGGTSWRTLYSHWDSQQRMPSSRVSGPSFPSFARGRAHGALTWVTVHSYDDCRLIRGTIRLRIIAQNVQPGRAPMRVSPKHISVELTSTQIVPTYMIFVPGIPHGYSSTLIQCVVKKNSGESFEVPVNDIKDVLLAKDEFVIMRINVTMPSAFFEIDALERLAAVHIQVSRDEGPVALTAKVREKVIWDMYERLSGGSWVRSNPMSNH